MTTVEKFRVGLEKGNPEGVVCKRQQIGVRAKLHSAPKKRSNSRRSELRLWLKATVVGVAFRPVRARNAVLKHPRMNSVFCVAFGERKIMFGYARPPQKRTRFDVVFG